MDLRKFNKFTDIPDSNLFVEKIPIFATQNYADYLKEIKNHSTIWFACIENNSVSFLLPFVFYKKIIFRKGHFLTGIISLNPRNLLEQEKEFLDNVVIYIRKNNLCDWIQQGPNWALFNTFPSDSKAVKFGTYKILLENKNEAELFSSIKKNYRQDINRAQREKVEIKKGMNYLNDCLIIINNTAKKANLDLLTFTEIEKMSFYFRDKLKIYVSYLDDVPQTAVIFLGNEYCTYALYAGSIIKAFRGANSYLDWEAILEAKKCNSSYFDFVGARINPEPGSKLERIQKYKKNFGSEFIQGYIWKMLISQWKFKLYNILLK
jgi:lipid II:glycine glycyltransferase (peptidoglycan interpeptide bridge formation enzyme)